MNDSLVSSLTDEDMKADNFLPRINSWTYSRQIKGDDPYNTPSTLPQCPQDTLWWHAKNRKDNWSHKPGSRATLTVGILEHADHTTQVLQGPRLYLAGWCSDI